MKDSIIITDPIDVTPQLRLDVSSERPTSNPIDYPSLVPWPLDPVTLLEVHASNPWLGAVANVLTDGILGAEPELVRRQEDLSPDQAELKRAAEFIERDDFALDAGFHACNVLEFLAATAHSYDATGNAFVEVLRTKNQQSVTHLNRLTPQYLHYDLRKTGELSETLLLEQNPHTGNHEYVSFGKREQSDKRREFLHYRKSNDFSSFYGLPPWFAAKDAIEVNNEHRAYLKGFFKNHGTPRWLIMLEPVPDSLEQEDDEKVKEWWTTVKLYFQANRGSMSGRNLIAQIPKGYKLSTEALDNKIEDPTFKQTSQESMKEILAVRHVSPSSIGITDTANRSISEEMTDNFVETVVKPFVRPALYLINKALFANGIKTYKLELNFDRIDMLLKRIEAVNKAAGVPPLSDEEGRALLGFGAKKDAKGIFYAPSNLIPEIDLNEGGPDSDET